MTNVGHQETVEFLADLRALQNDPPSAVVTDKIVGMAKKRRIPKSSTNKARPDADRRARQAERLSKHLRALRCIMGRGRWDAEALAAELECSTRTVHRILQTLTMAGVPWYFCSESQSYRVRPGFRFPGIGPSTDDAIGQADTQAILVAARQLLEDGERFLASLREICDALEKA